MKNLIHYLLAAVFLIFAVLQYNDPDFYIWVPVYAFVAIIAGAYALGRRWPIITLMAMLLFIVWSIFYFPYVYQWIIEGLPSITGSMKAESMYIERIREFMGLTLCLLVTAYYFIKSKNKGYA